MGRNRRSSYGTSTITQVGYVEFTISSYLSSNSVQYVAQITVTRFKVASSGANSGMIECYLCTSIGIYGSGPVRVY